MYIIIIMMFQSVELQHKRFDGTCNVKCAVTHLQRVLLYGLLVVRLNGLLQILTLVLDKYVFACQLLESLACCFTCIGWLWEKQESISLASVG